MGAHGTRTKTGVMILTPRPTLDSFPLRKAVDKDFATYGGNIPFMSIYVAMASLAVTHPPPHPKSVFKLFLPFIDDEVVYKAFKAPSPGTMSSISCLNVESNPKVGGAKASPF